MLHDVARNHEISVFDWLKKIASHTFAHKIGLKRATRGVGTAGYTPTSAFGPSAIENYIDREKRPNRKNSSTGFSFLRANKKLRYIGSYESLYNQDYITRRSKTSILERHIFLSKINTVKYDDTALQTDRKCK